MANQSKGRFHVFTDCDLDGAGAYFVLKNTTNNNYTYTVARVVDAGAKIGAWFANNDADKYDMIYIMDLDISQHDDLMSIVDRSNVTIIDHHASHIARADKYKHANINIQKETSTTKMVYKQFNGADKLTNQQKLLVLMVDDYDSYKFNVKNSYELNIVFWSYQGDRVEKFINDFGAGFTEFNQLHKNIISFYLKKLNNIKTNLDAHTAQLSIQGKPRKIVAVFADSCINDIADYVIKNYKSDIGIVVNLTSNKVSLRRAKKCDVDLSLMSKMIFDEGGGHHDAAGGLMCDKFLTFTKLFKPLSLRKQ